MSIRNKKLAQRVIKMAKADQQLRQAYMNNESVLEKIKAADQIHVARMKKIVQRFGWPTVSLVGKKASHLAWLLVQHADFDVSFQKYCLGLMKKAAKNGNVTLANIAFLTDRILVNQGKPQIYGTQFYKDKNGKLLPRPIKGLKNLDRRRKMGLETFGVYKRKMTNRQ